MCYLITSVRCCTTTTTISFLVHRYYAMPKCLSSNQLEACPEILHQGLVESIPCHFQFLSVCCMGPRKVHTYVGLEWDSFLEDME